MSAHPEASQPCGDRPGVGAHNSETNTIAAGSWFEKCFCFAVGGCGVAGWRPASPWPRSRAGPPNWMRWPGGSRRAFSRAGGVERARDPPTAGCAVVTADRQPDQCAALAGLAGTATKLALDAPLPATTPQTAAGGLRDNSQEPDSLYIRCRIAATACAVRSSSRRAPQVWWYRSSPTCLARNRDRRHPARYEPCPTLVW
jgi:hypothetical protein